MAAGIDQTDWAGLLKSAQNGQLQLLNVDSAALGKLTGYCEDLVADILGLIDFVTGKNMPPKFDWYYNNQSGTDPKRPAQPKPFPASSYQFLSMKHLSDAFFDKANPELVDILGNHQAIVTDIANTFTAANKKYSITEGQNANTFVAPNARDHWPEISKYHAASSVSWADGPGLSTTASSGVSFDKSLKGRIDPLIELGGALHLYDFANIAMLVGSVGGDMLWLSGEWLALSQIWGNSIDTFTKNIKPVFTRGHWQGAGADRAIASIDKYLGTAETLRAGMVDMSHVVGNTANFLAFIYGHVPRYDQIKLNTNGTVNYVAKRGRTGDQAQTYAQQWWDKGDDTSNNKGFVAGMRELAGQVPEFVDPNTAAPPTNGGTGSGGGTGNTNSGNGGGNSGNSGNSGGGNNSGKSNPNGNSPQPSSDGANPPASGLPPSSAKSGLDSTGNQPTPTGSTGPTNSTSPLGSSGPLSKLADMLAQLNSGPMFSGSPSPFGASGPWGASGPSGSVTPAGLGGGSAGGGAGIASPTDDKLFPRAGAPGTGTPTDTGRAGLPATAAQTNAAYPMGMGGYPLGGGMGGGLGGQGQQQQQERKRAAYLDGPEHLEEAVGDDPLSVRPIIDR